MAVAPITGMLRRGLVTDLAIALGAFTRSIAGNDPIFPGLQISYKGGILANSKIAGLGSIFGSLYWHGYHMPRTYARDNFYRKLEQERAAARSV
ncbi:cytochrome-c oxidase, subunit VIIa [Daldinia caldariorum]|uniref:cytochrome-c oxidase, subunit VIIa n=1 Tax=Daldinia caldariorum TaxID=326644 RepID=UPI002007D5FC|nr:cytochrome-c oxidase, subunit VIIa [Daldinia caldariorum]KAI1467776.1 cytochrome-c oxidase, subunit VIIa [Daldinia caldariorum]